MTESEKVQAVATIVSGMFASEQFKAGPSKAMVIKALEIMKLINRALEEPQLWDYGPERVDW